MNTNLTTQQDLFTVRVHNFKDDPTGENISTHGLYTEATLPEAKAFIASVKDTEYANFLDLSIRLMHYPTLTAIATAQKIRFVPDQDQQ